MEYQQINRLPRPSVMLHPPADGLAARVGGRRCSGGRASSRTFAGSKIGGQFTQSQAKALDILGGAFLAPILMAGSELYLVPERRGLGHQQRDKAPAGTSAGHTTPTPDHGQRHDLWKLQFRKLPQPAPWKNMEAVAAGPSHDIICHRGILALQFACV